MFLAPGRQQANLGAGHKAPNASDTVDERHSSRKPEPLGRARFFRRSFELWRRSKRAARHAGPRETGGDHASSNGVENRRKPLRDVPEPDGKG